MQYPINSRNKKDSFLSEHQDNLSLIAIAYSRFRLHPVSGTWRNESGFDEMQTSAKKKK